MVGSFKLKTKEATDMPEHKRLGIAAENPGRLAAFYQEVFDIPFAEYRADDPEGNGFDISEKGWKV